ncbi:hypothetical protein SKAU_G00208940 [Synaphobranchus kaupii]|uniref:ribonuclease H n=1 Tax=Synaphobranchus kaupii TaxID=118154 RepID=A0A9Q1ITU6_SYNKA|nr:hypothetical protein SKAU_G00208940 [Synaphobranchus kaupii]
MKADGRNWDQLLPYLMFTWEVNYCIRQPGRRPPEKVYHVNLLKKWVARDVLCSFHPPQGPAKTEPVEVPIGEQLSKSQRQDVMELVECHRDVFSTEAGRTDLIQHHIITEPGKKVKLRLYQIPEARREAVRQEVRNMLKSGVIEQSRNKLIERLGRARYISTLDLTKGYWQVPLAPQAREKTAFATPDGLFHYKMLPFGLHGAPSTFQRLMDQVLRPHREYAAAHLDDIVIHGEEWGTHLQQVTAVLRALWGAGRRLPGVHHRQRMRQAPAPLTDLTKSRLPDRIVWTDETEKAFQGLKDALCSGPVLVTPDFTKPLVVQTDASETRVRGCT